ncbi:MAG: hypothetical protein H6631_07250 [Anaerolineaceae bacterium]|nr:hypothetical protein [Anaerolineaceae bacterium]
MTRELPPINLDDPAQYRICAQGRFSPGWLDMLSGEWAIADDPTGQPGATILVGQVVDQAALLGVLEQLYSLGLPLLSVEHVALCSPRTSNMAGDVLS